MAILVTADPMQGFVDALRTKLRADAELTALVSGIYDHVPEASRLAYPYVVLSRSSNPWDGGAMAVPGGTVSLQVDCWSAYSGPYQARLILEDISRILERQPLSVAGHQVFDGSVHCELSEVFDEPDDVNPERRLYHGVQRWTAEIHATR